MRKEDCSMIVWHEKVAKSAKSLHVRKCKKVSLLLLGRSQRMKSPKTHRDDCHMEGLFETWWWCTKCYMNTKQLTCSRSQTWISHMPVSGLTHWATHPLNHGQQRYINTSRTRRGEYNLGYISVSSIQELNPGLLHLNQQSDPMSYPGCNAKGKKMFFCLFVFAFLGAVESLRARSKMGVLHNSLWFNSLSYPTLLTLDCRWWE